MLSKKIGENILLGKTSAGECVRVAKAGERIITEIGDVIREKKIEVIPIENTEIFKTVFPQYNDFTLLLRRDKYKTKDENFYSRTKDFGLLIGKNNKGEETVLMRQNKDDSAFTDITLSYDPNTSVPLHPNEFEAFTSEIKLYKPSDFQIRPTHYTKIVHPYARAYLAGSEMLKSTEKATDEFYRIMREETCNPCRWSHINVK